MNIENSFDISPNSQLEKDLTPDDMLERLRDHSYLPTHEDIARAFGSEGLSSKEWFDFCYDKENPIFELLNEEHIGALGDYLLKISKSLGASDDSPVTILEVGAGNGRLSHFIQQKLDANLTSNVKYIATDSGDWGLETAYPVEIIGHKEALDKYKPNIVIFSWMPYQEDVTDDFRATSSVEEYILIGKADGGCCGDEWRTWGLSWSFDEAEEDNEEDKEEIAPYIADGFERKDHEDISAHQICRTDQPGRYFHSSTISFKRTK